MPRIALLVLCVLNILVLMGQVLPDLTPPFAREVNIVFLIANLLMLVTMLARRPRRS